MSPGQPPMSPGGGAEAGGGSAGARWATELAGWAIPPEILAAAPESPWVFPVELFRLAGDGAERADTPSARRAREALPAGGSVLDVGCGGGAASAPLARPVGPAAAVTGVDPSPELLAAFQAALAGRDVAVRTVVGSWPAVADQAGTADVVVCHHVAYNVADLAAFAAALTAAARHRVVLELTATHPLAATAELWRRFHGLDRPEGPTAELAARVLAEAGLAVHAQRWQAPPRPLDRATLVGFTRRRLCLPPEREGEVDAALPAEAGGLPRDVVTLWWDAAG